MDELYFQLDFEEEDNSIDLEFEEIRTYNTSSHDELLDRNLPDQHTIDAITGLQEKLLEIFANLDKTYIHKQRTASSSWDVVHNLNKYPSVTIVDSANNSVIGEVSYIDTNHLIINFIGTFSGTAYLN